MSAARRPTRRPPAEARDVRRVRLVEASMSRRETACRHAFPREAAMNFWRRSIRQVRPVHRDPARSRRAPSRSSRLQLEDLEGRALLTAVTLSEYFAGSHRHVVVETGNQTSDYIITGSPPPTFVLPTDSSVYWVGILNTSAGVPVEVKGGDNQDTVVVGSDYTVQGILAPVTLDNSDEIDIGDWEDDAPRTITPGYAADTVNVLATGVPTNISHGGYDVVNVGYGGSVQGILGTLNLQDPPSYNTIYVNDSADATARTVTLSTYSSGGANWGSITGLAPAAINYKYFDTNSPVNISTFVGRVTWNVSANAMASVTGVVVDDNGFAINSLPADPVANTGYSPAPASAQLFNNGEPSYLDVEQGAAADCWLDASLAEVAARDPQDITNMFTYDGTIVDNGATVGLYTVRFFNTSGSAVYVQVDTELPSGREYYDHVNNDLGTSALWVALAEKAYAVANGLGYVTTNNEYQDSYNALNYGNPAWALHAITGMPASDYSINPINIASAWNSGDLIVLCTSTPTSSFIVGSHCYAMVGYNASSGEPFEEFNPWGTDSSGWAPGYSGTIYGLFAANAAFISQNFTTQSLGTGAINGNNVDEPVDALTGSATGTGGYARTGTINLTRHSPGGVADAETAAARGGDRPTAGDARPAQGTATGVDLWLASYAGDGDDPTTSGFRARRNGGW